MIIHSEKAPFGFYEYGIQIPIDRSKVDTTFEKLLSNHKIFTTRNVWHHQRQDNLITRSDIEKNTWKVFILNLSKKRFFALTN
jgi:hypothetical protein